MRVSGRLIVLITLLIYSVGNVLVHYVSAVASISPNLESKYGSSFPPISDSSSPLGFFSSLGGIFLLKVYNE